VFVKPKVNADFAPTPGVGAKMCMLAACGVHSNCLPNCITTTFLIIIIVVLIVFLFIITVIVVIIVVAIVVVTIVIIIIIIQRHCDS
jgi:hypothetical protein